MMELQEMRGLYEKHVDAVYRVCYSYLGSAADSEDAVQEVFLRLMDRQPSFECESDERGWLIVTACNYCKSLLRRSKRLTVTDPATLPEEAVWDSSDTEVLELIAELPESCRQVVLLHCCEGYSLAQIARLCGMNESTVRSRWFYARKRLKKILGGMNDEQ